MLFVSFASGSLCSQERLGNGHIGARRGVAQKAAILDDAAEKERKPRTTLAMSSTLNAIDMTPEETPAAEKPTMTAPDPEEAAAKKPTKRSNSFSRRANRGGKKKEEDAMPNAGGVGGGAAVAPAAGGGAAAVEDTGYVDEEVVAAKPSFKLEKQGNPLTDAIQKEAVELFEAGAYDDAGEKFYYLAEAAHQAGDRQQECTALQNMGTSMVMLGSLFEASRCYDSALRLAETPAAEIEVLESLVWCHSELGALEKAVAALHQLRMVR